MNNSYVTADFQNTNHLTMKRIITLILLSILLIPYWSIACNTCGCGVGNYHYGILPQSGENFVGVRYRYSSYKSTLEASHAYSHSYETFKTAELWARFYPLKRLQAFVFVPFNFNERQEGTASKNLKGLGDVIISANYNLINTYDSADRFLKHNLLVGAGVKLPTGEYRKIENGLTVNQNFQLGTGSVDLLFNVIHTVRHNNMGLNAEFSYNLNTTNKDDYRFGNAARAGVTAFYILRSGPVTVMPNVGISGEFFKDNKQFDIPFPDTGGWASLYNLGSEIYYRSVALGVSWTHPGRQALFNGNVEADDRVSAHVTVMF
jgi:hypothetical protein